MSLPDRAKEIVPTTAVPQYLDWVAEPLEPVSYTHLTLPTIYSV